MTDPIRVIVVDDRAVVRNGLVLLVQHEPGMNPINAIALDLPQLKCD